MRAAKAFGVAALVGAPSAVHLFLLAKNAPLHDGWFVRNAYRDILSVREAKLHRCAQYPVGRDLAGVLPVAPEDAWQLKPSDSCESRGLLLLRAQFRISSLGPHLGGLSNHRTCIVFARGNTMFKFFPNLVAPAACTRPITFLIPAIAALILPLVLSATPVSAEGTPVRVRGTVVSLDGSKLVVHAKDGKDVNVSLKDDYAALAVVKSSMEDIKQGTFIGTATMPQPDGSLRAVEVVVFPESLRGFAEGHYPWDLGTSSMMTNATIANKVQSTDGQTVNVTYKGGEKKITIPANVPIVALAPADKSDIKPGAIVFVPTEKQADDTLLSGAVLFGKDGVVPPM